MEYNQSKNEKALAYLKNESLPHILDENVSEMSLETINYYISLQLASYTIIITSNEMQLSHLLS